MACSYQTITLQPGESFVLPAGAQIINATDPNTITSVNDCAPLDNLANPICGTLFIVIDVDENDGHPNNEKDTRIQNITVGTQVIDYLGQLIIVSGDNPGTLIDVTTLNSYIPASFQSVFKFTNVTRNVFTKHQDITLTFESLDIFQDQIEMMITVFSDTQYYKPSSITAGPCS